MKITILTPTFNDEAHLPELVESVQSQEYADWQWIIINDGSTDNTPLLLNALTDPRITIIHQNNADQLNALRAAIPFIQGDIVCLMHSDDRFVSASTLGETVAALKESGCDGIYADYQILDENSKYSGILKVPAQVKSDTLRQIILGMGGNPIGDPFFVCRKAFFSHVVPNYIDQNTIYYVNYSSLQPLNLKKVVPWYSYRIFNENYIHSEIGKFVALSGQFRTASRILKASFNFSGNTVWGYAFFRALRRACVQAPNVFGVDAALGAHRYFDYWAKDLERYGYPEILSGIAKAISRSFLKKKEGSQRSLTVTLPSELAYLYRPADSRQFYKDHIQGLVPSFYYLLINTDYDYLQVGTLDEKYRLQQALDFLSLQYEIKII